MACASCQNQTCYHTCEGHNRVNENEVHEGGALERTFVEIRTISQLQLLLSRKIDKCEREQKQNKGSTNTTSVSNENLRLLEEEDNNDYRD